ncbi:MAG: spore coat protein [Ignavibacteriaceae bacterium]|nr:MAG: DegT/DnrJ/EryC1/StrS family aminotransferase [Chlorobiota bacterium]GJQ31987.1 MAG: spore coat protein [Ignavibacteriaceae bacterium]
MREKYLVFGSPVIEQEEIDEVVSTLQSGWLGTGPKVAMFEEEFRNYVGANYAIAVASCTAGLHLSVVALGIKEGDEVIVPALTFAATANAVIHSGAKPVLVDVDRSTMTLNYDDVKRKITSRTKAIIPVHFAGRAADMDELQAISHEYGIHIINDAAHAIETEYHGKKIGAFADITSYSFYVTKNLTTAEGGMIVTDNEAIANRLKIYALHGMSKDAWKRFSDDGYKHYQVVFPGFKYNMTDIQASLGIHQLRKVDRLHKRREEVWNIYNDRLKHLPLILPAPQDPNSRHGLHLYIILVDDTKTNITRDQLITELHRRNIGTGVHYLGLNWHPFYQQEFGYKIGDFPNSDFISERTLSIPFSAKLTDQDVEDVIEALEDIFKAPGALK